MGAMPIAPANGIQIAYETFGDPVDPTLLLIMGLGAQMVSWDDEICHMLQDRGFHVVRFDNRDVGESTWIDAPDLDVDDAFLRALGGDPSGALYTFSDMAADVIGLLDALGIEQAHVVGASMGGMIGQTLAIEHPGRVLTLTSIMSTTGEPTVGQPTESVLATLLQPRPTDPEEAVEFGVELFRAISSPEHFDPERTRQRVKRGRRPGSIPAPWRTYAASPSVRFRSRGTRRATAIVPRALSSRSSAGVGGGEVAGQLGLEANREGREPEAHGEVVAVAADDPEPVEAFDAVPHPGGGVADPEGSGDVLDRPT